MLTALKGAFLLQPTSSLLSTLAPLSSKSFATFPVPVCVARCKGVRRYYESKISHHPMLTLEKSALLKPTLSFLWTLAPHCSKRNTIFSFPLSAAQCKGVRPYYGGKLSDHSKLIFLRERFVETNLVHRIDVNATIQQMFYLRFIPRPRCPM